MSQKRMRAPSRTKASAVEVNVNDGTITVSPGSRSSSIADSSSAAVHEVVSSTSAAPVSACRISRAFWLNSWLEEVCPLANDLRTWAISAPEYSGTLKAISVWPVTILLESGQVAVGQGTGRPRSPARSWSLSANQSRSRALSSEPSGGAVSVLPLTCSPSDGGRTSASTPSQR